MIDGSVLQSAQRCFEKKSRVVVKMVVKFMRDGTLETNFLNFLTDYITRTALQKESGLYAASCACP